MPKIQFDVNVANAVAIDVANDVLSVWWMEVYPFCFNQSKPLFMPKKIYCAVSKQQKQKFNCLVEKYWQHSKECMCCLQNIAVCIY